MTSHRPLRARGFTLLELVVGLGMTVMLIAAAVTLLVNQNRAHQTGSQDRATEEAGRMALQAFLQPLRSLGYGVDPAYAIDFGATPAAPVKALRPPATQAAVSRFACAADIACRDGVAPNLSDEIVFYSRNPMFSRALAGATVDTVTITGDLTRPLLPGQVLQVACLTGSKVRAYVTVRRRVDPPPVPDPDAEVDIGLEPGVLTGGLSTFPFQNDLLADPCFSDEGVVARIDRYRYYVSAYTEQGVEVPVGTAGARPYLMLDPGLDDGGTPLRVPVAADVEDMQIAYLYPPAGAGLPFQIVGGTENVPLGAGPFRMSLADVPPAADDPLDAPSRTTGHPVNVRALRVSFVVRTGEPDQKYFTPRDRALPALGNRPEIQGVPGYRRVVFETTVALPNLRSGGVVNCVVGTGAGMQSGGC
jgi:type IV pilus assembly protein PilW